MSQIDELYFVRGIRVPYNEAAATDPLYVQLTNAIIRYENEILKKLLGYTLWKEYTDAVAASELDVDPVALATKWDELKNGAEFSFEYGGQTITDKWNGFTNSDKISLIAYYVYYQHRINTETSYTGSGEKRSKGENSTNADAKPKLVKAWNEMVNLYGKTPYSLISKDNFMDVNNYTHENAAPSAYNFLLANVSDYEGWIFTPLKFKHSMW